MGTEAFAILRRFIQNSEAMRVRRSRCMYIHIRIMRVRVRRCTCICVCVRVWCVCICTRGGNARIQFTNAHAHKYTRARMRFEFRKRQTISCWMQTLSDESAICASCTSTAGSGLSRSSRWKELLKWITWIESSDAGVSSLSPIREALALLQKDCHSPRFARHRCCRCLTRELRTNASPVFLARAARATGILVTAGGTRNLASLASG